MSLEEYKRKRNFKETPEPPPAPGAPHKGLPHFYVQRHHASHLHYDFRMEVERTLKSWAVPKGPTLDPAVKHFAAMVEDHPMDYGSFEGNIPKGSYGGGSVMLWDRGSYELLGTGDAPSQLARGDFKFRLHGEKLRGEFALVLMKGRGKGNEWLLLKKRDEAAVPGWDVEAHALSILTGRTQEEIARDLPARNTATHQKASSKAAAKTAPRAARAGAAPAPDAVKADFPGYFPPMAATLVTELPESDKWIAELKWDGVRALCFVRDGKVEMFTRNGNRCERQYPELSVLPHQLSATTAVLDGEIAVLNAQGIPEFALIQPRIMASDAAAIAHMTRSRPVILFLFDLLYLDGWDLRPCPLSDRRKLLEKTASPGDPIRVSEVFPVSAELAEAARQTGVEGLMGKCLTAPYEPRRSRNWLKLKLVLQQEFVICGFTPGERDHFGALVLGVNDQGKLRWTGNVGTGFDQKSLAAIRAKLDERLSDKRTLPADANTPKDVIWVKPELVCEVKFSNWTPEGRLRAPVFLGLRTDVSAADVNEEKPLPLKVLAKEDAEPAPRPAKATKKAPAKRVAKKRASTKPQLELPASGEEALCTVDGHQLKFSNLNKVFYPEDGFAKRDLLEYYDAVADFLLPHLKDRPLSLKRYPNGIHSDFFFQKNTPDSFPNWLRYERVEDIRYVLAEDRAALLYLTNLGCIDQNPWMSRAGSLDNPDWILIDLDPQDCPFEMIVDAAQLVKEILDEIDLAGYPKTTGGDGLHVYIPLEPVYTYDDARQFAEVMASVALRRRPELFTTPRSVSKRQKNRVYFDYLQNGQGKTIAAPYVVRAYEKAPVATPLRWREVVKGLHPKQFTIKNVAARFEAEGDLFADVLKKPQHLQQSFEKLARIVK